MSNDPTPGRGSTGLPGWWTLTRDIALSAVGIALMVHQGVWADPFNSTVYLGAMAAAGVPGALQGIALITGRTGSPSPSGPGPSSPPGPSTSSPGV